MTIADAVQAVLKDSGNPMHVNDIYQKIIQDELYSFAAKNSKWVMSQAIRERSDSNPKAKIVMFKSLGQGIFALAN